MRARESTSNLINIKVNNVKTTKLLLSGAILTALTACGGSGSDNTPADPQAPAVPKAEQPTQQNHNSGTTQREPAPQQDEQPQNPQANNTTQPPAPQGNNGGVTPPPSNGGNGGAVPPPNNGGNSSSSSKVADCATETCAGSVMAESIYQGQQEWGTAEVTNVQGQSNAPVLDIKLANGETYKIDTAALRTKGSNGGAIAKESVGQDSFRSFAVSDPQKYRAQTFGYLYEGNGKDAQPNHGIAFNSGNLTPAGDNVFNTSDVIKYKGDAYLGSRGDIVKGSSDIDVYFADKQLEGDFTFAAGQKRTTPGKENEDAKYPGKIKFFGEIDGNTFEGGGKVDNRITTTTTVKGQFYGEGAAEMGGTFQIGSFISYTDGSFGAIKQ